MGGLPDGVAGQNSPGNGLSNGLEGPNALPDGYGYTSHPLIIAPRARGETQLQPD